MTPATQRTKPAEPKSKPAPRAFFRAMLGHILESSTGFQLWCGGLLGFVLLGVWAYGQQFTLGLQVTGMGDQILWGLYIGNFTFLVGVAAAAVILLIPVVFFQRQEMGSVVLLGECLAIAAVTMSLLFVFVDLGQPLRIWHALPLIGTLHFPTSILAWDMVVLTAYLLLNASLVFIQFKGQYQGRPLSKKKLKPWLIGAIVLGIAIHTVTAFMLSGNPARPFWYSAVLAPRFIASAFAAGGALMILTFRLLDGISEFTLHHAVERTLTGIVAVSMVINLFLLGSEFFIHFYRHTEHALSAQYLYWGLPGADALTLPVRLAIAANGLAGLILIIRPWRHRRWLLNGACLLALGGIWTEKGLGLVVPAFIPTPLGEVVEYTPSLIEIEISLGIWAFGGLLFTLLARLAVGLSAGTLRQKRRLA
ncbi:MAG: polysulfide reductase NrfD [Magnetococcales bacterium]|nr:polysulfide reductase NrfD [Magnetococcales bacterium]